MRSWLTGGMPSTSAATPSRCDTCRHRQSDRRVLEETIPGLLSFSSGFGASVADSRLCLHHDRLVSPGDRCGAHESPAHAHSALIQRSPSVSTILPESKR